MKLKYRNFRRLKDAGPLYEGFDGILVLLFVMILCITLAFVAGDDTIYFLFIPALACAYAICLEVKSIVIGRDKENDQEQPPKHENPSS